MRGERHSAGLCLSKTATNQNLQIVLKPFVNCSKDSVSSTHEHLGYKSDTLTRILYFQISSRLTEMLPKQIFFSFSSYFYALLIFKALTEEYTYNLAHMVQTKRKTLSHLKECRLAGPHIKSMNFEL